PEFRRARDAAARWRLGCGARDHPPAPHESGDWRRQVSGNQNRSAARTARGLPARAGVRRWARRVELSRRSVEGRDDAVPDSAEEVEHALTAYARDARLSRRKGR